ncbi:MAG: DUF2752 domain-containing protein [Clostridium sp.]|nr:DUF2752 domain-containing protein [Clostridium sp.]
MSLWMNFIKIKEAGRCRADEIFYQIGKFFWLPFGMAGLWFSHRGYDKYGKLMECSIRKMSGLPCPGCGGTRAFYLLFRGELLKSFLQNPTVLFGVLAYLHFMLLCFYRKHYSGSWQRKEIHIEYYMYAAIAVILLQWLAKLGRIIYYIYL